MKMNFQLYLFFQNFQHNSADIILEKHTMLLNEKGFSLIEMLLALAMISILTLAGYPLYQKHVVKTHRNHAKIALLNAASQLEQFYLQTHTYEGSADLLKEINQQLLQKQRYKLEIHTTINSYTLIAVALAQQAKEDMQCGNLILKHNGEKQITGTDTILNCW